MDAKKTPKRNTEKPAAHRRYFDGPASDAATKSKSTSSVRPSETFDGATDFVPLDNDRPASSKDNVRREPRISHKTNFKKTGNLGESSQRGGPGSRTGDHQGAKARKHGGEEKEERTREAIDGAREDSYHGPAPVSKELLKKFNRGAGINTKGMITRHHKTLAKQKEKKLNFSRNQAARTNILQTETAGFLEADGPLEDTTRVTQEELVKSVDLQSQSKHFDLHLKEFGPYGFQYTRNGRFLMIFGKEGHMAAFDWLTKSLKCEMHVQERIHCGQWLHQETMFALGQKQYLHMYDNQGQELHVVKKLSQIISMDFLPYHFLLATGNEKGFLSWLDVSVGQMAAHVATKMGRLAVLRKNPSNAVIHLGHSNGCVSLWSPNVPEPLVKFLSHTSAVRALDIDSSGRYMATAASDRKIKVWDLRKYQTVQEIDVFQAPTSLAFSQQQLLAVGMDHSLQVFRDIGGSAPAKLYMQHFVKSGLQQVAFCPYEDVLGCGYSEGFTSLLIPGSGEAHFDAHESNPFQTKRQRQEMEVHSLLEKIPSDLIGLDASQISQIHEPSLQAVLEEKARTLSARIPKVEFTPKYKMGKAASFEKRKGLAKEDIKRQQIKEALQKRQKLISTEEDDSQTEVAYVRPKSVFDRFQPSKA